MDYHSLTRKELQALCKKYAIPANLTNVSMAEALTALLNADNNKPPDEANQKQDAASEDMGDKPVLTEVSNTPKGSTRSKRNGVAAEGTSAEEPILLDDEGSPLALKEKNVKSAPKNPRGKGEPTGKSRTRGRPGKLLDEDELSNVNGISDVSVNLQRDGTCKSGRMRSRHATSSKDVKPLQVKQDSCDKEEESDEENESVEEVPEEKHKERKKVDKLETATEGNIQGADGTNDESVEQFHKTRPKGRSSRKKFDEVKEAAEESIPGTITTNDESVEVSKTRPKTRLSRKKVDKVEEVTQESIETDDPNDDTVKEVPENRPKEIHATSSKDVKPLQVKRDSCDKEEESDEANESVEGVPEEKHKGRKKVDKLETATEGSIQGADGTNDESVEQFHKTRPKGRSSRKKLEVKEVAEESIQGTIAANDELVEVPKTRPKARLSRKRVDKVEEATQESIETDDPNDDTVKEVPVNRPKDIHKTRPKERPSRKKLDEVKGVAEESIQESIEVPKSRPKARVLRKRVDKVEEATEESTRTDDPNDESDEVPEYRPKETISRKKLDEVEVTENTVHETDNVYNESVEEFPESRPKERPSRKKDDEVDKATEESIQGTDDANYESVEVHKTRSKQGRSSKKQVHDTEEVTEEMIEGVERSKGDLTQTCRRSMREDALKGLDSQPLVIRSSSRKKVGGVNSARKLPGTSKTVHERDNVYSESVEEFPESRPKERLSRKKDDEVDKATEESIQGTDDANYESFEVHKTRSKRGRSSKKQVHDAEEVTEESIQGVERSKGDLTQTCRRSTGEDALKGLDTQPLVIRSSSRRNAGGVNSVRKIPGTSKTLSALSKGKLAAKVEDSSDKKEEIDPAETLVKVSDKINMKTPVQTLNGRRRSKKDSSKLHNGDCLEASAIKVKQESTCQQRQTIQSFHHLAAIENEEDSNCDLDSYLKQDRAGNRRSVSKETAKSQGKYAEELDILEADVDAKENQETIKKEVTENGEASKDIESEEVKFEILQHQELKVCQILDEKQMACHISQEERTKQVQKESVVEISPKKSSESLGSPISGRVDEIGVCSGESILEQHTTDVLQEVKMNTIVINGMMMSTEHSVTLEIQESNALKSHSKCLPAEGSAMKNNSFTNSTYAQDGEDHGIKVEESWERTVEQDVNRTESYSGSESETMHKDLEVNENAAFYHGMDSRDAKESPEKTAQDDLIILERTEPEIMRLDLEVDDNAPFSHGSDISLKGEAPDIKDEESQGKAIQEGVGISENNCGTELETENAAFSHGTHFIDIAKITIDAQEAGEDHCIEDEDNPDNTVRICSQEGVGISESHCGTKPDSLHEDLEDTKNTAFSHGMHSRDIAQSPIDAQDEDNLKKTVENGSREAEDHCIEDKDNLEETIEDGPQDGEDHCLADEDYLEENVENGPQHCENHCIEDEDNLEKTVEDGSQEAEDHCIEYKDNLEKAVKDGSQYGEDRCIENKDNLEEIVADGYQDGDDHYIEDEDYLDEIVVDGPQDGEDHCFVDGKAVEDGPQDGEDHCIVDENNLEKTVEDDSQEAEDHCIEDKDGGSQDGEDHYIEDKRTEPEKTMHFYLKAHDKATFSHGMVSRNVEQICMPFNEGEASLIKYEESWGNIGVDPEIVFPHNVVAPGIKDEESPGKTLQEGVSISKSHTPTEPETMHVALVDENKDSICIEKSKEIIISDFNDMEELNCSRELSSAASVEAANPVEDKTVLLDGKSEHASSKDMMVAQEVLIGEPRPTEKECLHTEIVVSDDLKLVGKHPELQQCTANLVDETMEGKLHNSSYLVDQLREESQSDSDSTEEDWSAKDSVLSVMPNILESQGREGDEGQEMKVQGNIPNNEACSDEVHIWLGECKGHSLVPKSPVTLPMKTKDGSKSNDKSFEKLPTGVAGITEDEDVYAGKTNFLMESLGPLSIDCEVQTETRVASSSAEVDKEVQTEKWVESSPAEIASETQIEKWVASSSAEIASEAQIEKCVAPSAQFDSVVQPETRVASASVHIDSQPQIEKFNSELEGGQESHPARICTVKERIEGFSSHGQTSSSKCALAKELIHSMVETFVPETEKNGSPDDTVEDALNDESASMEDSVPLTPPKEEKRILVPISDEQVSTVEQEIYVAPQYLGDTDEGLDEMSTNNLVENLGVGDKKPLAVHKSEQNTTEVFENMVCMEDIHLPEKICGPDEELQVGYGDKLQNEAKNNSLLIEKEKSLCLNDQSLRKLYALCKKKKAKVSVPVKGAPFNEKTFYRDEEVQATYVNKLRNEFDYNFLQIEKEKE
ncbi:hypothetical protein KI387_025157, partial [Taxus chinensis]